MTTTLPVKLRVAQVRALQALAAAHPDGMTAHEIERKTGTVGLSPADIGPLLPGHRTAPGSLLALKMVSLEWHDIKGTDRAVYYATERGLKAAKAHKLRARNTFTVPNGVLDPVVSSFRKSRTYGFEFYTEADLKQLRSFLPVAYENVGLEELRGQVISRRKVGAYSEAVEWPRWYSDYREGEHFRRLSSGFGCPGAACALNGDHEGDTAVYHRSFTSIGVEEADDCIVLCASCYKRNRKALPKPPARPLGVLAEQEATSS